jgi:hypothetical protein
MAQVDGSGTFEEKLPSKGVNLKMLSVMSNVPSVCRLRQPIPDAIFQFLVFRLRISPSVPDDAGE